MTRVRHAFRTLAKSPFVTAVAVLSLALGIGANAAIFSLFDQVMLRGLPVENPDRLVNLEAPGPKPGSTSCNQAGGCDEVFSYPMFRDLERDGAGFAGLAAHRTFGANIALDGQTTSGDGVLVSGGYFRTLGMQPALGRLIGPDDDRQIGANPVAVLSHRYWANDLGADPGVLDRTIVVNGQPLTVIGVAAPGFDGTTFGVQPRVFVPLTMTHLVVPGWDRYERRTAYYYYVFGRLRPGGTMEQALSEANSLYSSIINEVEVPLQESMTEQTMERFRAKQILGQPGRLGQSSVNQEARAPLILLAMITGFVLLIACANIANLLLAKGASRGQEMALRSALGGGRRQLLAQLLTESMILALLGGLLSLLVAYWTLHLIASFLPPEAVQSFTFGIDPSVMLFTAALAVGTGLVFGLYPALQATRSDLIGAIRASTGQASGGRKAQRGRKALVTFQFAMSLALLAASGLFLKSLLNVSRVDLGIRTENLATFRLSPSLNGYDQPDSKELFRRTEQALASVPGVSSVSSAMVPAIGGSNWGTAVSVEGFAWEPGVDAGSRYNAVGAGYFTTLGMPLLAGREFTDSDVDGAPRVAVVNEAFARKFGLDGRGAIGKYMATDDQDAEELDIQIVGLVQDAAYSSVKDPVPPLFFLPYAQADGVPSLTFYARTAVDPSQVMGAVPELVEALDPNLPVTELKTLQTQIDESVFLDRMISVLTAGFAVLATLLAAVGLYGVLAFTVAQRTREFGVRMALGAGGSRVRRMVLAQVGGMALVGGLLGLAGAYALSRVSQSLLFEVEGTDPWVLAMVGVVLALVALGAGYVPALRASRVDPMEALRYE
ncbi:MAG: ABC transporter permease [Gemmatimonadota bacterium]|jgi:predicted permease